MSLSSTLVSDYLSEGTGAPVTAPAIKSGTLAFYLDKSSGLVYAYNWNTPAWVLVGGSGGGYEASPTKPLAASFTLLNPGSATMTDGVGGLRIDAPSATGMRLAKQTAALPATPWTLKARVTPLENASNSGYQAGVFVGNSVSGKLLYLGHYQGNILAQTWANYTTFNANVVSPYAVVAATYTPWWGIKNDGTTITLYISNDGNDWYTLATTPLATYLGSIDMAGFGIFQSGADGSCVCQSLTIG